MGPVDPVLQLTKVIKRPLNRPYVRGLFLQENPRPTGPIWSTNMIKKLFEGPLYEKRQLPCDYTDFCRVVREIQCTCGRSDCLNPQCDWNLPACLKTIRAGEAAKIAVANAAEASADLKSPAAFFDIATVTPALNGLLHMVRLFRQMSTHLESYKRQWRLKGESFGVIFDLTLEGMQAETAAFHDFFMADAQSLYLALKNLHNTARDGFIVRGFQALQEKFKESNPELEAFDEKTQVIPRYAWRLNDYRIRSHQAFEQVHIRTHGCREVASDGIRQPTATTTIHEMIRDLVAVHKIERAVAAQWRHECLTEPEWNFETARNRLEKLIDDSQEALVPVEIQAHQKPLEAQNFKEPEELQEALVPVEIQALQKHQDFKHLEELWNSLDSFQDSKPNDA